MELWTRRVLSLLLYLGSGSGSGSQVEYQGRRSPQGGALSTGDGET